VAKKEASELQIKNKFTPQFHLPAASRLIYKEVCLEYENVNFN
jgi:hypothetical protein